MKVAERAERSGFTIIEIVIVTALVALMITLLYRFFVIGSRTVTLGTEEVEGIRRANITMERIKRDLRSLCDIRKATAGAPEVAPDGGSMTFLKFNPDASAMRPGAVKVVYKTSPVTVKRGDRTLDAVKLEGFYGDTPVPAFSEDVFSEVRFTKYWLHGYPFYQVRFGVPDLTGKNETIHYLQTSVGSRYYHALLSDPNWLPLSETQYEVTAGRGSR